MDACIQPRQATASHLHPWQTHREGGLAKARMRVLDSGDGEDSGDWWERTRAEWCGWGFFNLSASDSSSGKWELYLPWRFLKRLEIIYHWARWLWTTSLWLIFGIYWVGQVIAPPHGGGVPQIFNEKIPVNQKEQCLEHCLHVTTIIIPAHSDGTLPWPLAAPSAPPPAVPTLCDRCGPCLAFHPILWALWS